MTSTNPHSKRDTQLAILLCVLLLCSLAAAPSASSKIMPEPLTVQELADMVGLVNERHSYDWHSLAQDWQRRADSSGFVDVIISFSAQYPSQGRAYDNLAALASRQLPSTSNVRLLEDLSRGMGRQYSAVFQGFSAYLTVETLNQLLSIDPSIQAYPDLPVEALLTDSIPQIGADEVWTYYDAGGNPVKGSGVVVAIADTGVDYSHPDLGAGFGPGYKVIGGYDFCNNDPDPMDDNGHGTHVAGIVAANGGVKGVAPEASILAYKVLDSEGYGTMSTVISGIDAAMDPNGDGDTGDHADIISMSLGGDGEQDDPLCLAVRSAVELGIVVVVAAGNDGPSFGSVASPGIAPEVVTVGAEDDNNVLAEFSSRGTAPDLLVKPEICAPGVDVRSTVPRSGAVYSSPTGYLSMSGTSMATPHVSGAAALLLQLHPDWTPAQVKSALITGAVIIESPSWYAGAGGLWCPSSANTDLFAFQPIVSYGFANDTGQSVSLQNTGPGATFSLSTSDLRILSYNGSLIEGLWTNASYVQPASINIPSDGICSVSLVAPLTGTSSLDGYYEGVVIVGSGAREIRIPFGFAVLSRLNVHVISLSGSEVFDSGGLVWVYSVPDASLSARALGLSTPVPPASFLLPPGEYAVHSAGRQILYSYTPYFLSTVVSLAPGVERDLDLNMSKARRMTLDLRTEDGYPIYAKDFRMYCRYAGQENNVSFHVHDFDFSKVGDDLFSLPSSRDILVSDTNATIGISVVGFSYSSGMWDFMSLNWPHWFEWSNSTSTDFRIETTADLQYMLSWEFQGVDSTTPLNLGVSRDSVSIHETKYDIPGAIGDIWGLWGTHRAMGADASFYERRVTGASLNGFFSGMTRKTIVQGVFSDCYWPGTIFGSYMERKFYIPDYTHTVVAPEDSSVRFPDRNFLMPELPGSVTDRLGSGPFYPSVFTSNTNETLVLFHPLLVDQAGARINGLPTPKMSLTRDGVIVGTYTLEEVWALLNGIRTIGLAGPGSYVATIKATPLTQVCNEAMITLGFGVPSSDLDPPRMSYLKMPERFVPGNAVELMFGAIDERSSVSASVSWRPGADGSWNDLSVDDLGSGHYSSSVQTQEVTGVIDLRIRLSDASGNFLEYFAANASLRQAPVLFEISPNVDQLKYRPQSTAVTLTGRLTDIEGNPLSPYGGVPLELTVGGKKVGMILDEYVLPDSHSHNGSIRFDWTVDPTRLFSGPNETIEVSILFDLGIYEPIERTFQLHSVYDSISPPAVWTTPAGDSRIAAGDAISVCVSDDGWIAAASYSVDGCLDWVSLVLSPSAPGMWVGQVETYDWTEGMHDLRVSMTDNDGVTVRSEFWFEVDANGPSIEVLGLVDGSRIPEGWEILVAVSDPHLAGIDYAIDSSDVVSLSADSAYTIYTIDTTGLSVGMHELLINAYDLFGHVSNVTLSFEVVASSLVVSILSPVPDSDGDVVIHSGVPIVVSVLGFGNITCYWSEYGVSHYVESPYEIPTVGWQEGEHLIILNATNDIGAQDGTSLLLIIDDTPPLIVLDSPANNSFVDISGQIGFRILDLNFRAVTYTLWGQTETSTLQEIAVSLASSPADGYFELEVNSSDKAGNAAEAAFRFAMDTSPPAISVGNVISGDAVRRGYVLDVTADDPFLTTVEWWLDGVAQGSLNDPYAVATNMFSGGWHELTLVANDASGKQSSLHLSLYIDAILPSIQIVSSRVFKPNISFAIAAEVSDDYSVRSVSLFYELRGGGYGMIPMTLNGTRYVASLAQSLLWDGMTIYVLAEDGVGNRNESAPLVLRSEISSGGIVPDDGSGGSGASEGAWDTLAANAEFSILVILAGISVGIAVLLVIRRRTSAEKKTAQPDRFIVDPIVASNSSRFTEYRQVPAVSDTLRQVVTSAKSATQTVAQKLEPLPARAVKALTASVKPSLIEAIPEITLKADLGDAEEPDEVDYGEMIERELNLSAFKKSVFRKEIHEEDVDQELESLFGGPQIVSGLMLKKLIDLDKQQM